MECATSAKGEILPFQNAVCLFPIESVSLRSVCRCSNLNIQPIQSRNVMIDNSKGYSVQPKVAIEFLGRFSPFKELGPTPIEEIVGELEVEFYPKGTPIFRREITEITHLHIIQKGSVKVFVRSESDTFTSSRTLAVKGRHWGDRGFWRIKNLMLLLRRWKTLFASCCHGNIPEACIGTAFVR